MHPRIEEVLASLDEHRAALEEAVAAVPVGLRERRPTPDRWSAAEVMEHLALVNASIAPLLAERIAAARAAGLGPETGTSPVLPTFDPARLLDRTRRVETGEASQPSGGLDAEAAAAELARHREAIREAVLSADGLALGDVVIQNPVFGPLNVYQWVAFVAGHEGRHAAQIRELAVELSGAR